MNHHPANEDHDTRIDWHLFWSGVGYLAVCAAFPLLWLLGALAVECAGR